MSRCYGRGYSVWLIPEESRRAIFQTLINDLGARFHTTVFDPHITLLSALTDDEYILLEKTRSLAYQISPFFVQLSEVEHKDEFFKCLYLRANKSDEMMGVTAGAAKTYNAEAISDYMPHLSLVYGGLSHAEKRKIKNEIGHKYIMKIKIDRICLYSTQGQVGDWYKAGDFALK